MAFDGSGLTKASGFQVPGIGRSFNLAVSYNF